ncbi:tetratricopeptide repeat protein [Streptacidiphilus sp. EB129]|uniref:tetratricopeptide repeat protein n=1 Tax=Streptacidiphilus sp. EB129 TaxID=3156262 RepID=UPI003513700D
MTVPRQRGGVPGRSRALLVCGVVAAIAVLETFSQIIAQTLHPGELLFWVLTGGAALLTGGAAVLALFPVRTRDADGPVGADLSVAGLPLTQSGPQLGAPAHNLPPLSVYFTGRDDELHRIEELLLPAATPPRALLAHTHGSETPRVCAIHGLGGVGKSQLALAYARKHVGEHLLSRWLNASRPNTLRGELLELAACVGIPYDESHTVMLSKLWTWLRDQPGWLLVYDDVQDFPTGDNPRETGPLALSRYLPPEGNGEIIITSQRRENWNGLAYGDIALAPLGPADGLRFLRKRSGADQAGLAELGSRLGWLPLALEQAGAYLDLAKMSAEDYLGHLPALVATGAADEKTFQLAIDRVTRQVPGAEDLLRLCAYLASEDVPHSTLYRHRAVLPPRLRRMLGQQPTIDRVVILLVSHSLLTSTGDGRNVPVAYGLHPRVQLFIRSRLDQLGRLEWSQAAVRLVEAAFPHSFLQPDLRAMCERLMPHVEASTNEFSWGSDAVADEVESEAGDPEAIVRLLHRAGSYQEHRCDWPRALLLFEREAQLRDLGIGDPLSRARARLAVARQYFLLARLAEAETACREALAHCAAHRAEPEFLPVRAECLRELGGILREQTRFDEALDAVRQAVTIYQAHGSEWQSLDWAIAEQQAGLIHRNAGRPSRAAACFRRAERLVPARGSQELPQHLLFRATIRRDLGILAQDRDDLDEAERELRAALAVFHEQPGATDFDTVQIAKFLADVLRRQGEQDRDRARATRHPLRRRQLRRAAARQLQEAWLLLEPVVALHYKRRDTDEHKYASTLNKRGSLEFAQGRAHDARATLEEAERIYRTRYGERHHYRAKTLSRLGPVLRATGDRDRAEAVLREAASIFQETLGDEHPALIAVYLRLADCLDDRSAEAPLLRALAAGISTRLRAGPDTDEPPQLATALETA